MQRVVSQRVALWAGQIVAQRMTRLADCGGEALSVATIGHPWTIASSTVLGWLSQRENTTVTMAFRRRMLISFGGSFPR